MSEDVSFWERGKGDVVPSLWGHGWVLRAEGNGRKSSSELQEAHASMLYLAWPRKEVQGQRDNEPATLCALRRDNEMS